MSSREDLADGERKIEAFLTDLAVRGKVAASTQNQAMNALVFLYRKVLEQPLDAGRRRIGQRLSGSAAPSDCDLATYGCWGGPTVVSPGQRFIRHAVGSHPHAIYMRFTCAPHASSERGDFKSEIGHFRQQSPLNAGGMRVECVLKAW